MFDLNAAIDQWVAQTVEDQPDLGPHSDELADHVLSLTEALIADGHQPVDAFTQALEALGEPRDLAEEFRKDGGVLARLRRFIDIDRMPSRRQQLSLAAAWILLSLFWAGFIFVDDTWGIILWTITTFLPLSAVATLMARRIALAEAKAGETRRSC